MVSRAFSVLGVILLSFHLTLKVEGIDDRESHFEVKIRPILAGSCIQCHGAKKASGNLRLDSRESILLGGDSGPAVDPGNGLSSMLVRALRHEEGADLKMPPEKPLGREILDDFVRWIDAGAIWPQAVSSPLPSQQEHWAFEPLRWSPIPEDPTGWGTDPIDRWIAAKQKSEGLHPVAIATREELLRRATYDLTGLPPTPDEIDQFLGDDSPNAFERVVDRLLESPRYGERYARHWLDLVRYADTAGDNADYPIPQAYLYRDYVIDAMNNDIPYDRFLLEQLAGDLLAKEATEATEKEYARLVIATGFIAQAKRIGTRELEDMHLIIEDTLSTLGPALLGLSLRCARCHDHKYDPLTMADYYALYGFFASTQYPFAGAEEVRKQTKFASLVTPRVRKSLLDSKDLEIEKIKMQFKAIEGSASSSSDDSNLKELQEKLTALEKSDPLEKMPTAYAVQELNPVDVPIQKDGSPRNSQGVPIRRGVPKILDENPLDIPEGTSGRLELARWLTSKGRHLTSRVLVNRLWQYHFGKPLVSTPSDFGFRGTPPTHPELLDYLAQELIASDWSLKKIHRRIMLSKTYQLSSQLDPENVAIDSGNKWYWRFDRRRLDAESLRDSLLVLSGSLDGSRPGPHPFPDPSKWRYTAHHQFNDVCYPSNHRSVYLMVQRLHAHPYLSLFNGADPSLSTPSRDPSTVPLQSLYLLNNEFVHQQSVEFSKRLRESEVDGDARIDLSFRQTLGRHPSNAEREGCRTFLARSLQMLELEGVAEDCREVEAWAGWVRTLFASNEFFFLD